MFESITPQMQDTLDRICTLVASNPHDARVNAGIEELKRMSAEVLATAAPEPEPMLRNAAATVADGLLAAAAICSRLQTA